MTSTQGEFTQLVDCRYRKLLGAIRVSELEQDQRRRFLRCWLEHFLFLLSALTHLDCESVPIAVQYVATVTAELRCYVSTPDYVKKLAPMK